MAVSGYVNEEPLRLSDNDERAQGGEAIIFEVPPQKLSSPFPLALKYYLQPNDPRFANDFEAQRAVREKLGILQTKLREIPRGLPSGIVTPIDFFTDRSGARIDGYTMRFLKGAVPYWNYSQVEFRERGGVNPNSVVSLHRKLHSIVESAHSANVIFADFNSLNVMVLGDEIYYVDFDSAQWGKYLSTLYTLTYVDPLLCIWNQKLEVPELSRPHNKNSDWYAFTVMFMENMLYTGPYDGNYRPKKPADRVHANMRPLKRLTVWNKDVVYPKYALPLKVLPDDLSLYLTDVFHKDKRGVFPVSILDNLRWTTCTNCGAIHARNVCPECAQAAPAAIKQKVIIRGKIVATRIFPYSGESGTILHATTQGTAFRFLYHDGSKMKREDGTVISRSQLDTNVRYRISGNATLFAKNGRLVVVDPGKEMETIPVDSFGNLPMFDANGSHYYWLSSGSLYRDGDIGPEFIGRVLENQSLFWVGSRFGFGFWRVGAITSGFVFDAESHSINDDVQLAPIKGQLLNSTATFASDRVWFFTTTQSGGKTINTCTVVNANGSIEATAQAQQGDGSWLGTITGKCAIGTFLLSATDDGITRVEPSNGSIVVTREFPDAEQFVHSGSYLYPHSEGLVAVTGKEIYILKIS